MSLSEEEAKNIAHAIAFGHAYEKHASNVYESGELLTRSSFESLVLETLLNSDKSEGLKQGRVKFWNDAEKFLVIFNPNDPEQGTAYWPITRIHGYKIVR